MRKNLCGLNGIASLRPKSLGQSLMVSGFCCSCHGFLNCDVPVQGDDGAMHLVPMQSYTIIRPRKDHYWTNDDLAKQLEMVIPLFQHVHPNCQLLFAFDNSQNHHAKRPDALVANRLNLSDGGASVPLQRNTTFINSEGILDAFVVICLLPLLILHFL